MPKVDFAVEEMLIEDFLEGVPCNRWEENRRTYGPAWETAYRKEGYDPQASVRGFLPPTFGPPFRGIPVPVHGDPHPANLIIMTRGRMGVVDYGRVGIVTKQDLTLLNDLVFAIYAQNPERTTEALLRLGNLSHLEGKRRVALERDIGNYVRECRHQPFDYWLVEMSRIQLRHGIPSPDTFTLIACFAILANRVASMFFPNASTLDLVGAEIREGMRQQMLERFTKVDPFPFLYELSLRVQQAPSDAARVIQHPVDALAEIIETLVTPLREKQPA